MCPYLTRAPPSGVHGASQVPVNSTVFGSCPGRTTHGALERKSCGCLARLMDVLFATLIAQRRWCGRYTTGQTTCSISLPAQDHREQCSCLAYTQIRREGLQNRKWPRSRGARQLCFRVLTLGLDGYIVQDCRREGTRDHVGTQASTINCNTGVTDPVLGCCT